MTDVCMCDISNSRGHDEIVVNRWCKPGATVIAAGSASYLVLLLINLDVMYILPNENTLTVLSVVVVKQLFLGEIHQSQPLVQSPTNRTHTLTSSLSPKLDTSPSFAAYNWPRMTRPPNGTAPLSSSNCEDMS